MLFYETYIFFACEIIVDFSPSDLHFRVHITHLGFNISTSNFDRLNMK